MQAWQLALDPASPGRLQMQKDIDLFMAHEAGTDFSILRLYRWNPPCISLGYSQKEEEEIEAARCMRLGWDVARRPTGGGIVFHNRSEITFSLITAKQNPALPAGLIPSYLKISEAVIFGLKQFGIAAEIAGKRKGNQPLNQGLCFSYPAEYEVVYRGKKIVGSAQKRGKRTILQQGSVFVSRTPDEIFQVLKKPYQLENAVSIEEILGKEVRGKELIDCLVSGFKSVLEVEFNGL